MKAIILTITFAILTTNIEEEKTSMSLLVYPHTPPPFLYSFNHSPHPQTSLGRVHPTHFVFSLSYFSSKTFKKEKDIDEL